MIWMTVNTLIKLYIIWKAKRHLKTNSENYQEDKKKIAERLKELGAG
ncbi:hypothetical protein N9R79_07965 [Vibrio sp.]|nr:hypothetical protein [Vibrio sp.]